MTVKAVIIYNDQSDPTYPYHSVTEYAQQIMYPDPTPPTNKGAYLRARLDIRYDKYSTYHLQSWYLGINGNPFPDEACNILFMDDTPTHTINPDGFFNRSYVFEQFALTKPLLILGGDPYGPVWHELGHNPKSNFWQDDDLDFTGGNFPKLTH